MKLTVGPLPPAVYWRRRAAVLGALLVAVLLFASMCNGKSDASKPETRKLFTPTGQPPASSTSPAATPTPTASVFTPEVPPPPGDQPNQPVTPLPPPPASPTQTGPCTDSEMLVTAVPESTSVARGAYLKLTLKIKNVSGRACTRDVGADEQELYLSDAAGVKVWSSDVCDPVRGSDVRTFQSSIEIEFYVVWPGRATAAGCANRQPPPAGRYQLVGRLATKLSEPVGVDLR